MSARARPVCKMCGHPMLKRTKHGGHCGWVIAGKACCGGRCVYKVAT